MPKRDRFLAGRAKRPMTLPENMPWNSVDTDIEEASKEKTEHKKAPGHRAREKRQQVRALHESLAYQISFGQNVSVSLYCLSKK